MNHLCIMWDGWIMEDAAPPRSTLLFQNFLLCEGLPGSCVSILHLAAQVGENLPALSFFLYPPNVLNHKKMKTSFILPSIFLKPDPVIKQALCRTINITHRFLTFAISITTRYSQILISMAEVREMIRQLWFTSSFLFSPYWSLVIDVSHQCSISLL